MKRKLNEEYRFNITPEDVRGMMADDAPVGSEGIEVKIPWELYDENREMIDSEFHREFENGDREGSQVRVMDILDSNGMLENTINEGGVDPSSTQGGLQYLEWVSESMLDLISYYGLSFSEGDVEEMLVDEEEIVWDFMYNNEEPNTCAEFLLKSALGPEQWNIITMKSGANESVKAMTISETFQKPDSYVPPSNYDNGYTGKGVGSYKDKWAYEVGDVVRFETSEVGGDDWDDYEQAQMAKTYDGQLCSVTSQEMNNGPVKTYQYYNIQFRDDAEMFAVSGYHLEPTPNS